MCHHQQQASDQLASELEATVVDLSEPTEPGRPVSPAHWRIRAALLLLMPVLLVILASHFLANTDPDYWWHIRTGQYIYETRSIPRVDIYSFTASGRPWITHEWLTEIIFYVVQRQLGYVANVALFGLLAALTWLAVYASCRLHGVGEPGAAILLLWGFAMSMASANVRPQAVTALFGAIYVLILSHYKHGKRRWLWFLPVLMVLWVNLHGGYVIGLAFLVMMLVGEAVSRALRRPSAPLRPLALVSALTLVASLANPHGVQAWLYPFSYAGVANASMRYIAEWQSPDFHETYFLIFASSLLLAVVLGLGRSPLGATGIIWSAALTLMALQSVRHIPLYAVTVTPLLGARLKAHLTGFGRPLAERKRPRLLLAYWLLPVIYLVIIAVGGHSGRPLQFSKEPSTATYPAGGAAYLRSSNLEGNLFNEYGWGGYLIYELYPERQVFIDGRADVYGDALVQSYIDVVRLHPNWQQVLEDHEVSLALVEKDSPLAVVLTGDSGWSEVYEGDVERLFLRQGN
ncbi:MAG: hypothetical protein ACUVWR_15080 [Anaerolineae bacterium]